MTTIQIILLIIPITAILISYGLFFFCKLKKSVKVSPQPHLGSDFLKVKEAMTEQNEILTNLSKTITKSSDASKQMNDEFISIISAQLANLSSSNLPQQEIGKLAYCVEQIVKNSEGILTEQQAARRDTVTHFNQLAAHSSDSVTTSSIEELKTEIHALVKGIESLNQTISTQYIEKQNAQERSLRFKEVQKSIFGHMKDTKVDVAAFDKAQKADDLVADAQNNYYDIIKVHAASSKAAHSIAKHFKTVRKQQKAPLQSPIKHSKKKKFKE